ncbi:hypothetical protein HJG54_32200 [Leptolyngbya sp. NK1-12]|uniref:Uncharacterized protein n=1 Tax=Leptolyngbya sp. NK1-12 TaxID=2547451 RepID=A0AA96WZ42_9CYAN|nr:hypothetical protein [Leptolyngbya sp. NK1-12]WNZ27537.1 hypothetical protein HJG54_32200 [Leptolyngbya sp. NK1-12]
MAPFFHRKSTPSLLLAVLNVLADFDGEISGEAAKMLSALRHRTDRLPPLYSDVFGLPASATCADFVRRVESLSQQQVAIASYAFQIFRSYEQLLSVSAADVSPHQQAAYESQLERVRLLVARTRVALAEAISRE